MAKTVSYTEVVSCGHCGNRSPMRLIGSISDTDKDDDPDCPFEVGTIYELCSCPSCGKVLLRGGHWDERMEPEMWRGSTLLPSESFLEAQHLLAQKAADRRFMEMAVAEAGKSKSKPEKVSPFVGAVIAREKDLIAAAHRGEMNVDDHAEFTALEGKCSPARLAGATVYVTLEPCTSRSPGKTPCVERLISRKIARVVIGMLDPNENIRGKGILALRKANIQVDLFPPDLMSHLEDLNRVFIKDREDAARIVVAETQPAAKIVDKWVGGTYADNAGITTRLATEGYSLAWVDAASESERIDLGGWEHVLENLDATTQYRLKIRDASVTYLVLLKKKAKA